jgi:competence protein ComEA
LFSGEACAWFNGQQSLLSATDGIGRTNMETDMKEWWKIAFGVLCGLLGAGVIWLASRPPRGQAITLLSPPTPAPIVVHVVGAIARPGVYYLPAGSRVQDAIQAAGGLLPEANSQVLNLAALLQDGGRVSVPTAPPALPPMGTISQPDVRSPTLGIQYPININTASLAELDSLPGIGPITAQLIIDYRENKGPFKSIEDIMNVSGIGPKTFEEIKDLITV